MYVSMDGNATILPRRDDLTGSDSWTQGLVPIPWGQSRIEEENEQEICYFSLLLFQKQ